MTTTCRTMPVLTMMRRALKRGGSTKLTLTVTDTGNVYMHMYPTPEQARATTLKRLKALGMST